MKLSKAEEQLMKYIWKLEKAFMKDLIQAYPDPKPATSTIATMLKRMKDKGYVDYRNYSSVREYYPLVKKSEYFATHLKGLIKNYFDDSAAQFASFFTTETDLSERELEELKEIIDLEIKKKKS